MSDFDFTNDSMLEMYLFESTTLLEQLDDILLQSEKSENLSSENINEIFRIMHTIKGSSAMMEFDTITHVSHKLEDLFYVIREHGIDDEHFTRLFDLVLKVSDFLKEEVDKVQRNLALSEDTHELTGEILSLLAELNTVPLSESLPLAAKALQEDAPLEISLQIKDDSSTADQETDIKPEADGQNIFHLNIRFAKDCGMENIRAFMLVTKLNDFGTVLKTIPAELNENSEASVIIATDGFYCTIKTDLDADRIMQETKSILSVDTVEFINALPVSTSNKPRAAAPQKSDNTKNAPASNNNGSANNMKASKQNLISVGLNKLDSLMDLVGEIVITESMVSGSSDLAGLELENFDKAARQLRKLTDELQDIVMSIRMVPIASTFQKMKRIVRDMGKKLSKDVDLVLMGESTEVDKTIIDGIADPLMHLVRNAMDHAIESAQVREDAGKNPVGKIILSAQNMGGDILISVHDDGKGLDAEVILQKAEENNILSKPESEYSEKEIFNLLTAPGFSTKDNVTEFSGRGVGMDVVKKNVEKIGGTVTIESVKGIGTTIFFKIPLTLAIIASMEIKVGNNIYAVPIANIRESFKATAGQLIKDPEQNEMIMLRGVCYPIIRLHQIFRLEDTMTNIEDGILLLVDSGDNLACIFADDLIGKHQIVVKPLPIFLNRFSVKENGIAGCTILGDGSISLILDIQGILN